MESSLLQDVLRKTVVRILAGQLQPHMGHSHRCLLVLHLLQLPKDLRRYSLYAYEVVSNHSWWCSSHCDHDRRHHRRIFLYPYHLEQYIPPCPAPALPPVHTRPHNRPNLLHRDSGKSYPEPNSTPRPRNCPVLHPRSCNPHLRHHAIRSDVRRSCCRKVEEIPCRPNIHSQLSFRDDETAAVLRFSLVPRIWSQVHRIVLILDPLLPGIH